MSDVARTGAAKRRWERRLRSWLRHERTTVVAELSAALHHSRDGVTGEARRPMGTEDGQRSRREGWCKTRTHPHGDRRHHLRGCGRAVSLSPRLSSSDRTVRRSSRDAPSLAMSVLAAASDEAINSATLSFLVRLTLEKKEEEEAEKREEEARKKAAKAKRLQAAKEAAEYEKAMLVLHARVSAGETLTASEHAAWYRWCAPPRATSSSSPAGKRRKWKKTRRRTTTSTSSWSPPLNFSRSSWHGFAVDTCSFIRQSGGFWIIPSISMRRWTSDSEVDSLSTEGYRLLDSLRDDFKKMLVHSAFLLDSGYTRTRQSTKLLHIFTQTLFYVLRVSGSHLFGVCSPEEYKKF